MSHFFGRLSVQLGAMTLAAALTQGGTASAAGARYDGLSVAKQRLGNLTHDHRTKISGKALPVVQQAVEQVLTPSHPAVLKRAPLVGLTTRVNRNSVTINAQYEAGPWSDLTSQTVKVSLKTGKGTISSTRHDEPGVSIIELAPRK